MKIVLPKIEHLGMLVMLILFFLPWTATGPVTHTGIEICIAAIKRGGALDDYLILATFIFVILALLLALTKNSGAFMVTLAITSPLVAFGYAFFTAHGNYLNSMRTAYILAVLISLFLHLKRLGIITFQK